MWLLRCGPSNFMKVSNDDVKKDSARILENIGAQLSYSTLHIAK